MPRLTANQHYTANSPELYISVNKNRLRVNPNNTIYIQNGTEFQLEFYNKSTKVQKATITINGKRESSSLVLNPNDHFYLDRFMDEQKKFKFETYEVDDVYAVRQAIKNNGTVKVEFYNEIPYVNPLYFNNTTITYPTYPTYYNTTWTGGLTGSLTANCLNVNSVYGSNTNVCDTSYDSFDASMELKSSNKITPQSARSIKSFMSTEPSKIETGRVERGAKSDQDFVEVSRLFEQNPHTTIEYNLKPISAKPAEVNIKDIRTYCSDCGRRMKENWKHCPGCGCKL